MKSFWLFALILLIGHDAPSLSLDAPAQRSATVTVVVLDSRGHPQAGCKVLAFARLNDGTNKDIAKTDYKDKFDGLIGRNIPFGYRYQVDIRCGEEGVRGTFLASVERADQFIVLSGWTNLGDYVTGPVPRLEVFVRRESTRQIEHKTWVKLVGLYLDTSEIDEVHPQTQSASFFSIVPGRYFLLVVDGESLACAKQIDFLESHAQLELTLSKEGCKAERTSSAKVLE